MKSYVQRIVANEHAGLTVEAYLKGVLRCSGRRIQRLTRHKGILLNGRAVFLQQKVRPGDILRVLSLTDVSYGVKPEPGPIEIVYEDKNLVIVNKQANLLVHPAGRTAHGTLANFLAYGYQERGLVCTIRPLHRLDRETTGCVLFAKDARTQFVLEQQLREGILKRSYWAVVSGIPQLAVGTIDAPIGPHPTKPNRRAISKEGEPAITHYRTLRTFASASLLELSIDTGRTHQVRIHLAHIGHPILGDRMYGMPSPWIGRQALHALSLRFVHPAEEREIEVRAPLPADLDALLRIYSQDQGSVAVDSKAWQTYNKHDN